MNEVRVLSRGPKYFKKRETSDISNLGRREKGINRYTRIETLTTIVVMKRNFIYRNNSIRAQGKVYKNDNKAITPPSIRSRIERWCKKEGYDL